MLAALFDLTKRGFWGDLLLFIHLMLIEQIPGRDLGYKVHCARDVGKDELDSLFQDFLKCLFEDRQTYAIVLHLACHGREKAGHLVLKLIDGSELHFDDYLDQLNKQLDVMARPLRTKAYPVNDVAILILWDACRDHNEPELKLPRRKRYRGLERQHVMIYSCMSGGQAADGLATPGCQLSPFTDALKECISQHPPFSLAKLYEHVNGKVTKSTARRQSLEFREEATRLYKRVDWFVDSDTCNKLRAFDVEVQQKQAERKLFLSELKAPWKDLMANTDDDVNAEEKITDLEQKVLLAEQQARDLKQEVKLAKQQAREADERTTQAQAKAATEIRQAQEAAQEKVADAEKRAEEMQKAVESAENAANNYEAVARENEQKTAAIEHFLLKAVEDRKVQQAERQAKDADERRKEAEWQAEEDDRRREEAERKYEDEKRARQMAETENEKLRQDREQAERQKQVERRAKEEDDRRREEAERKYEDEKRARQMAEKKFEDIERAEREQQAVERARKVAEDQRRARFKRYMQAAAIIAIPFALYKYRYKLHRVLRSTVAWRRVLAVWRPFVVCLSTCHKMLEAFEQVIVGTVHMNVGE